MSYFTQTELETLMSAKNVVDALDDDRDGTPEKFDEVRTAAEEEVDSILSVRFVVPFTATVPKIVKRAALTIAASLCYSRRGFSGPQNPYEGAAMAFTSTKPGAEGLLILIAKGKLPLDAAMAVSQPEAEPMQAGSIVSYDSPLGEPTRRLA